MDLSFPNDFDDRTEINKVETASVDDEFLSSEDEFCSTYDDNPSFEKFDMMHHHNEGEFTFPKNIYETIQLTEFTDIEPCKDRKGDCIAQQFVIADMYGKYACVAGFYVRKSTNKRNCAIGYMKYLLCNREGFPNTSPIDIFDPKTKKNNHPLISRDNMLFSRHHRQLDDTQKSFILTMSNQNIGATIAYSDAQMLVDKLNNRKKNVKNFSFEYRVENKKLNTLFWANETSKISYKEFGDVVSFDATFRTNRYHMIFVPFTGIDNHKRCQTTTVGLFDQDPAMKKAIEAIFPRSIHRFCMWHITSKLPLKVSLNIVNNLEFCKNLNFLIWNSRLEVDEFEVGWKSLLNEYKLTDNKWLDDIHGLRHFWIPTFFKHVPLSGLMTTTSRSKSENSAFHQNSHYGFTVLHFMISFEAAMEK
ncbi:protein FAR1-RELATED SEQUENCE 5-like [Lactuca sativa]|uniref:protein FAR1-RELATED SEQUENCE 5-like n=1 Tax=Lactuca sativa TaxID=4236 RepID=UPI000CD9F77D|nr:protein FAR1-RELATED SEQUENCE 5-like [Lactuca sativa]